ncbi:MAG: uncharacterized protein A8A55_1615 [Amphiamblys sp. WSBS2006]|nr:MAG: uncharacterized protein A8A55_1615 [Amphiamblys sp. WSBS2006]
MSLLSHRNNSIYETLRKAIKEPTRKADFVFYDFENTKMRLTNTVNGEVKQDTFLLSMRCKSLEGTDHAEIAGWVSRKYKMRVEVHGQKTDGTITVSFSLSENTPEEMALFRLRVLSFPFYRMFEGEQGFSIAYGGQEGLSAKLLEDRIVCTLDVCVRAENAVLLKHTLTELTDCQKKNGWAMLEYTQEEAADPAKSLFRVVLVLLSRCYSDEPRKQNTIGMLLSFHPNLKMHVVRLKTRMNTKTRAATGELFQMCPRIK